jgi:hypothetical protein
LSEAHPRLRRRRAAVTAAPQHTRRQIAAPIRGQARCGWLGHLLSKGPLHGIHRDRCVSSLRRCRKLRRRHPWGLRHRPIDRLGSLRNRHRRAPTWSSTRARTCSACLRLRPRQQGARYPGDPGLARPSVDHQHRRLHGACAEPVQGLSAGLSALPIFALQSVVAAVHY